MSRSRRTYLFSALIGGVLLAILGWRLTRSPVGIEDPTPMSGRIGVTTPSASHTSGANLTDATSAELTRGSELRHPERSTQVVRDPEGAPLANATASWTVVGVDVVLSADWPMPSADLWAARSTTALTDVDGGLHLDPPAGSTGNPSVIWLTCPGFRARSFSLGPGETLDAIDADLSLAAGDAMEAIVDRGQPSGVPGAEVFQRPYLSSRERAGMSAKEVAAAYALQRRVKTDGRGVVVLGDLGMRQVLSASQDSLASNVWIGTAPGSVELTLQPTFTWRGKLTIDDPTIALSNPTILVVGLTGSTRTIIDSATLRPDGTAGPRSASVAPTDSYLFELEGAGIPTTIQRVRPQPGELVNVEFVARRGVRYPVHVTEADASAITGAEVQWAWSEGEHWQYSKRFTDAEGMAVLDDAPIGASWLLINKPGFIGFRQELVLEGPFPGAFEVVLEKGATLRGNVLAEGRPLRNFTIAHRPVDQPENFQFADIYDSRDGSFAVEGLPVGERAVFAFSTDWPRCSEQTVTLSANADAQVEFELHAGREGTGFVRDATTGEPVAGASVQVWTSSGRFRTREWGAKSESDTIGRFEVSGLAPTDSSVLEFTAVGYARAYRTVTATSDASTDLGVVGLSKPHKIEVRLRVSPQDSARNWSVSSPDAPDPTPVPFSVDGVAVLDGLAPAVYPLNLSHNERDTRQMAVEVPVDGDATAVFDLTGGSDLEVDIVADGFDFTPTECALTVQSTSHAYEQGQRQVAEIPEDGRVRLQAVGGPNVHLFVYGPNGRIVGSYSPSADEFRSGRIVMKLGGESRSFRLVDSKGAPQPGVLTMIGTPQMTWINPRTTNSAGEVRVEGLSEDTFDLFLARPPFGGGILRNVRLGPEPFDIVFDSHAQVHFRLLDGDTPVQGVSVWIRDALGMDREFPTLVTDDSGYALGAGYLPQEFRCTTHESGIWPKAFTLQAVDEAPPKVVQVRRRGSVVLYAKRGGLPLAGVVLHVESEEFETSATMWIASGAITASDAQCVTDGQGRLRLDGLPRGPYRWTIELNDGVQVGGGFDVEPQRRVDVDVNVP